MLFTSLVFIYIFLPIILLIYYIANKTIRNYILLIASLFFYAWGEPVFVFLMIFMILINYYIGIAIHNEKTKNLSLVVKETEIQKEYAKLYLILGISLNLFTIGYFKYSAFIIENINNLFNTSILTPKVRLPIGISFFTFQALSYLVDLYRNEVKVQKNLGNLMLYISLFPQLIAGPIVRYKTVDEQILQRDESISLFASGVNRFVIGLGKKVLLANNMAIIADRAFNEVQLGNEISIAFAWVGVLCYTLQIYFDFSGYSDMAIGLGRMFGFEFLENFNYPYISSSISEFWRRWHISLGTWFRDYLYIPLGGNRRSISRNILNLSIVWFLTGFWHGANWTFILWGCYFGLLIVLEKYLLKSIIPKLPKFLKILSTLLLVVLGWVLFRAENLETAINYYKLLFGISDVPLYNEANMMFFIYEYSPIFLISMIAATPFSKTIINKFFINKDSSLFIILEMLFLFGLMYLSTAHLVASNFNPFIYFNF